jgi:hypothetical protein
VQQGGKPKRRRTLDPQFLDEKQMDNFISKDEKPFTMGIAGAKKGKGGRKVSAGHGLSHSLRDPVGSLRA